MSLPVVEWSPGQCRLYDPETGVITAGNTVADFTSQLRGRRKVVVAVSRRSSFVRATRLPDLPKPEMKAILAHQLVQLMPMPPGEASVDILPTDDVTSEGRTVFVAAVRNVVLRELYDELKRAGLEPETITPSAFASCKIAQRQGMSECAVVSNTPEGVAIDLVMKGVVRSSRVVPTPGDSDGIMEEVERTFAASKAPQLPIVATGSLSLPGAVSENSDPLSVLSEGDIDLKLELPEVEAAQMQKLLKQKQGLAMLMWVAFLGVAAVVFDIRNQEAEKLNAGQARWEKRLILDRADHKFAEQRAREIRAKKEVLESAFQPKQSLDDVISVLTTLTPKGVWLTAVTLERGKRVNVRGTSLERSSVTAYLNGLTKQSRFRDIKLNFANSGQIQETPVVNFSIAAHVVGNFPLPVDDSKKKVARP